MKIRYILFFVCTILMSGCGDPLGSFQKGTIDYRELIIEINRMSSEGTWEMELLQDESINDTMLSEQFLIRGDQLTSYAVFIPVISISPCAIAIFEGEQTIIDEAITKHIEKLKQTTSVLSQHQILIDQALYFQIGNYHILIIGKDAQKIKTYMESL